MLHKSLTKDSSQELREYLKVKFYVEADVPENKEGYIYQKESQGWVDAENKIHKYRETSDTITC